MLRLSRWSQKLTEEPPQTRCPGWTSAAQNPVETASPVGVSANPVEAVEGALVGEILFDICPMKLFDRIGIAREVGMALRQAS